MIGLCLTGCSTSGGPAGGTIAASHERQTDFAPFGTSSTHVEVGDGGSDGETIVIRIDGSTSGIPRDSSALARTQAVLPENFRTWETRQFVVLSDTEPDLGRLQSRRLERAAHEFHRVMRRIDVEPGPIRHKLVCVCFDERSHYHEFARTYDGVRDSWIAGYYAPESDRVVFYQSEDNPSVHQARTALVTLEAAVDDLGQLLAAAQRSGLADADHLERQHSTALARLQTEQERIDRFVEETTLATTIHEAVHQLAFHTRVQSPFDQPPIWLSEGLATSFETDNPDQAFGPEHEYAPRRDGFTTLLLADDLYPLTKLVGMQALPSDASEADVARFYNQSYAFFVWCYRYRTDQLGQFMRMLNAPRPDMLQPDDCVTLFEASFGAVKAVERSWLAWERANAG